MEGQTYSGNFVDERASYHHVMASLLSQYATCKANYFTHKTSPNDINAKSYAYAAWAYLKVIANYAVAVKGDKLSQELQQKFDAGLPHAQDIMMQIESTESSVFSLMASAGFSPHDIKHNYHSRFISRKSADMLEGKDG